ncbi:hypothetical protein N7492_004164 [Penicillium capsulatum]|uniref:Uncharacterized protein n=1 Tax=Penicillium capsulatum TaxID=69766 RepID=A0A9W9LXL4_9EURO|nr:hypothetical protein N7492_004164 [Penicillium capsulatum]
MFIKPMITSLLASADQIRTRCQERLPNNYLERYLEEFEDEDHALAQVQWVQRHRRQTRRGNEILQREMHLGAMLSFYQNMTAEQIARDSSRAEKIQDCKAALKTINLDYWQHRAQINEIEKTKPRGRLVQDYVRIQHRRPERLWKVERIFCRLRGGCCSRDCGCCERTWRTIRDPHGLPGYLHCGRSCGCCERHRE